MSVVVDVFASGFGGAGIKGREGREQDVIVRGRWMRVELGWVVDCKR